MESTWSGKRAAKHAGLAFLLVVLVAMIPLFAGGGDVDPEKLGEGAGRLAALAALLAFGASYAWQTSRKPLAYALGTCVAAAAMAPVIIFALAT